VHKNLVDAHAIFDLGCVSLCQELWGSIGRVWCWRQFLWEDVLHGAFRLEFRARLLLCRVGIMVGERRSCVW